MMHRAWSSTVEVPYCFSRSYVKFQGHPALKIVEFDPNWAFPDCNSSLNLPMAMKCCTKLETAKERCSIVFLGHPSNFKVTRYKTSPILTQIGRFRTIGRSQLSNPSDLPCFMEYHFNPIVHIDLSMNTHQAHPYSQVSLHHWLSFIIFMEVILGNINGGSSIVLAKCILDLDLIWYLESFTWVQIYNNKHMSYVDDIFFKDELYSHATIARLLPRSTEMRMKK